MQTCCSRGGIYGSASEPLRHPPRQHSVDTETGAPGDLIAEVEVNLLEAEAAWRAYLSLDDAYELDEVRDALRAGDVERGSQVSGRSYRSTPVA